MNIFENLARYFSFSYVQYAFIVGLLIALCSSLLGVTLVLKRFSFIGDGLSHVAFFAMAIAGILHFSNDMPLTLGVTVLCAVLLIGMGKKMKVSGDAAVALISVSSLALGYLFMYVFPSASGNMSADVCSTLFGSSSILTLKEPEVWLCVGLSVLTVGAFIFFYNKIFAVTFDENFARATGTRATAYNMIIAVIISVVIVLAMNLVGSLLISALIIFPALSAMKVFKSFRAVTVCSACLSVGCAALGLLSSIIFDLPVGSAIVSADMIAFGIFSLIGIFRHAR